MNLSNRQFEANRRNAGKSTGPKTEEGKAISSQNARTHGFTATTVVLSTEDELVYEVNRLQFHDSLKPVGFLETELVDEIASARWRQQRCIVFETALIDRKIDEQAAWFDEKFEYLDLETRGALGLNAKTNLTKALRDLSTFEQRHRRTYEKAMKELKVMQKERKESTPYDAPPAKLAVIKTAIKKLKNEANSEIEHREKTPVSEPKPAPVALKPDENEDQWPEVA
jgi:hypothetical protein